MPLTGTRSALLTIEDHFEAPGKYLEGERVGEIVLQYHSILNLEVD